MDKATLEIVGNVGTVEIRATKGGDKLAVLSVETSERWKRDNGDWAEKMLWHSMAVFLGPKVERIEAQAQKDTRMRLVGQVRPARECRVSVLAGGRAKARRSGHFSPVRTAGNGRENSR